MADIKKIFPNAEENVPASKLTTFGVGGIIKYMTTITSEEEITDSINKCRKYEIPFIIISGGSNIVFQDGIIETLVIKIANEGLEINGTEIYCEAGTKLSFLVRECARSSLAGLESLTKIPGSVGGAIYGNAGAYGQSISDRIVSVDYFDGEKLAKLSKEKCKFVYRGSIFKKNNSIIVGAQFKLDIGNKLELQKKRKKIIDIRSKKYRKGLKCPGSYFKNVLVSDLNRDVLKKIGKDKIIHGKIPAGYLLEEVGACGMRCGGVRVASYHGNLFINEDGASFSDVMKLANTLKKRVKDKFGIKLSEEVMIMK